MSFIRNWWYGAPKEAIVIPPPPIVILSQPVQVESKSNESQIQPVEDFNHKIEADRLKIKALIASWEEYKKVVMLEMAPALADHEHQFECDIEKHNEVHSVFAAIAERIRNFFKSVSANLQAKLDHEVGDNSHIKALEAHIIGLCEKIDASSTDDERRDVRVHICNASLTMLDKLDYLANEFHEEIASAISLEVKEEELARKALMIATMMLSGLIGITLPFIEFDCRKRYENVLTKSIANQEFGYDHAEHEVETILEKARRVVLDGGYAAALRRAGGSVTISQEQKVESEVDTVQEQPRPV